MAGFDSALYLGLGHGHARLRPWAQLTAGMPAALAAPEGSPAVAGGLASLAGLEAVVLGVSTLHLVWDLFGQVRRRRLRILADAALYPVGRWGVERAAASGVAVETFAHQDAAALERRLAAGDRSDRGDRSGRGDRSDRRSRGDGAGRPRAPLVVTDGLCPDCGRVAPIDRYLAALAGRDGWLVLDDSQALGLLGAGPRPETCPYGRGGGGSAAFLGASSPRLLVVASLAKAFGAPVAMLGGSATAIESFVRRSETRIYASPPSVAAVRAAEAALAVNRARGDWLRARLARRVARFRECLGAAGIEPGGGLSPVQNLAVPAGMDAGDVHRRLAAAGVRPILRRGGCRPDLQLTLVLRADHEMAAVERAAALLAGLLRPPAVRRCGAAEAVFRGR